MKKGLYSSLLLILLLSSIGFAQWTNQGAFPDANLKGDLHGIAVDPLGRVWASPYTAVKHPVVGQTDSVTSRVIYVFNPDGTQASFSPIWRVTGPGFSDTLVATTRGMRADNNGNILYVNGSQLMYRINYLTGEGMNKVNLGIGTSPTAPAVSSSGQIFVAPVVNAGFFIQEYDTDFNFVGNAVGPFPSGFSRSIECSPDGNTLYFPSYTRATILVYQRADELSAFDSIGTIMDGVHCESVTFNKVTGNLWASGGSYNDLPDAGSPWSPNTWYEYNVSTGVVENSIAWDFVTPFSPEERPRGIDFSTDGLTAYFGCFGFANYMLLQKATYSPVSEYTVTFSVDMGVQAFENTFDVATGQVWIRGDFQTAAGDPGGNWQGNFFEMSDTDGDTIYTLTVSFPLSEAGNTFNFKYVMSPDNWESSANRVFSLMTPSLNLQKVWFNNDNVYTTVTEVTNTLEFTADISGILGVGVGGAFDANQDSLLVMGLDWDNFGKDVVGNRRMANTDPFNSGIYTTSLTFTSGSAAPNGVGDSTKWKFRAFPDSRFANTGWETGSDRWHYYVADGSVVTLPTIVPNIYPLFGPIANDVPMEFNVDMTGAVNRYNGLTIPLADLQFVGIKGAASFLGSWGGNWTVSDTVGGSASTLKVLHNVGGNMWRYSLVVPAGTNSGAYEYKFAAMYPGADTINGGSSPLDNEGGFGTNHLFILSDNPSGIVINNVFGGFTGVERVDNLVPKVYSLEQNYPNPFNPSTIIRYSIPEAGFVTLRVFNLLGQEVALLVNGEQVSGVYEATFDAAALASGIYFYTLDSKNFSTTKKMLFLK